jgi:hypothetical protein
VRGFVGVLVVVIAKILVFKTEVCRDEYNFITAMSWESSVHRREAKEANAMLYTNG